MKYLPKKILQQGGVTVQPVDTTVGNIGQTAPYVIQAASMPIDSGARSFAQFEQLRQGRKRLMLQERQMFHDQMYRQEQLRVQRKQAKENRMRYAAELFLKLNTGVPSAFSNTSAGKSQSGMSSFKTKAQIAASQKHAQAVTQSAAKAMEGYNNDDMDMLQDALVGYATANQDEDYTQANIQLAQQVKQTQEYHDNSSKYDTEYFEIATEGVEDMGLYDPVDFLKPSYSEIVSEYVENNKDTYGLPQHTKVTGSNVDAIIQTNNIDPTEIASYLATDPYGTFGATYDLALQKGHESVMNPETGKPYSREEYIQRRAIGAVAGVQTNVKVNKTGEFDETETDQPLFTGGYNPSTPVTTTVKNPNAPVVDKFSNDQFNLPRGDNSDEKSKGNIGMRVYTDEEGKLSEQGKNVIDYWYDGDDYSEVVDFKTGMLTDKGRELEKQWKESLDTDVIVQSYAKNVEGDDIKMLNGLIGNSEKPELEFSDITKIADDEYVLVVSSNEENHKDLRKTGLMKWSDLRNAFMPGNLGIDKTNKTSISAVGVTEGRNGYATMAAQDDDHEISDPWMFSGGIIYNVSDAQGNRVQVLIPQEGLTKDHPVSVTNRLWQSATFSGNQKLKIDAESQESQDLLRLMTPYVQANPDIETDQQKKDFAEKFGNEAVGIGIVSDSQITAAQAGPHVSLSAGDMFIDFDFGDNIKGKVITNDPTAMSGAYHKMKQLVDHKYVDPNARIEIKQHVYTTGMQNGKYQKDAYYEVSVNNSKPIKVMFDTIADKEEAYAAWEAAGQEIPEEYYAMEEIPNLYNEPEFKPDNRVKREDVDPITNQGAVGKVNGVYDEAKHAYHVQANPSPTTKDYGESAKIGAMTGSIMAGAGAPSSPISGAVNAVVGKAIQSTINEEQIGPLNYFRTTSDEDFYIPADIVENDLHTINNAYGAWLGGLRGLKRARQSLHKNYLEIKPGREENEYVINNAIHFLSDYANITKDNMGVGQIPNTNMYYTIDWRNNKVYVRDTYPYDNSSLASQYE